MFRGFDRNKPICWFNSVLQFLIVFEWSGYFFDYGHSAKDVLANIFKLIAALRENTNTPIQSFVANQIAGQFIDYVNLEKTKISAVPLKPRDACWHLGVEQDAQACLLYYFNMLTSNEMLTITDETIPIYRATLAFA